MPSAIGIAKSLCATTHASEKCCFENTRLWKFAKICVGVGLHWPEACGNVCCHNAKLTMLKRTAGYPSTVHKNQGVRFSSFPASLRFVLSRSNQIQEKSHWFILRQLAFDSFNVVLKTQGSESLPRFVSELACIDLKLVAMSVVTMPNWQCWKGLLAIPVPCTRIRVFGSVHFQHHSALFYLEAIKSKRKAIVHSKTASVRFLQCCFENTRLWKFAKICVGVGVHWPEACGNVCCHNAKLTMLKRTAGYPSTVHKNQGVRFSSFPASPRFVLSRSNQIQEKSHWFILKQLAFDSFNVVLKTQGSESLPRFVLELACIDLKLVAMSVVTMPN